MKAPCQACGKMLPRKRLVPVLGLKIRDRIARACQECFDKPDKEHRIEDEREYGKETFI